MTKEIWNDIIKHGAYEQELDWYAVDREGKLGVFSAIMYAPIPEKVKSSYEKYIRLNQLITSLPKTTTSILTTTEQGDFSSWITYSDKGLFAFDFYDIHRKITKSQYDLITQPILPLRATSILPADIMNTLVELDCSFSDGDIRLELIH